MPRLNWRKTLEMRTSATPSGINQEAKIILTDNRERVQWKLTLSRSTSNKSDEFMEATADEDQTLTQSEEKENTGENSDLHDRVESQVNE